MAENKKSFLLYCDLIHTINKMPDDKAGQLLKHIFAYVNDLNPETDDLIIQLTFEPIKQQLKRDLVKWGTFIDKQSKNGAKGGRPKKPKESQETQAFLNKPKKAVNVNVSVNDNVKVNNIEERKLKFADTLKPYVENYGKEMIRKFFDYWTEPNKSNTKMLWELKKTWSTSLRLKTWSEKPYNNNTTTQPTISKNEQRFNKFQAEADGAAAIIRAKYGIKEDS